MMVISSLNPSFKSKKLGLASLILMSTLGLTACSNQSDEVATEGGDTALQKLLRISCKLSLPH